MNFRYSLFLVSLIVILSSCITKSMAKKYIRKSHFPESLELNETNLIIASPFYQDYTLKSLDRKTNKNYDYAYTVITDTSLKSYPYNDPDSFRYVLQIDTHTESIVVYPEPKGPYIAYGTGIYLLDRKLGKKYQTKYTSSNYGALLKAHLEVLQERCSVDTTNVQE